MSRLNLDLVMHHLIVEEGAKLVKQKLRKMHPKITLLVKAKLKKLLDIGFIRPIDYVECVSNIVPMEKPTRGIHICKFFRELNRYYPKYDFPLPNINMIVDMIVGHAILSLMDGFFRYNQIKLALEDQHKIAFTFPWGTYYWNMMSFSLKNVGDTY